LIHDAGSRQEAAGNLKNKSSRRFEKVKKERR
jgi:hypothetical protein